MKCELCGGADVPYAVSGIYLCEDCARAIAAHQGQSSPEAEHARETLRAIMAATDN